MRLLCGLFLLWLLLSAWLGHSHSSLHPDWILLSIMPVSWLQFTLIRRLRVIPNLRDNLYQAMAVSGLLLFVFLTGLSAQMGFLPLGLHQGLAWLLVIFAAYEKLVLLAKWKAWQTSSR